MKKAKVELRELSRDDRVRHADTMVRALRTVMRENVRFAIEVDDEMVSIKITNPDGSCSVLPCPADLGDTDAMTRAVISGALAHVETRLSRELGL